MAAKLAAVYPWANITLLDVAQTTPALSALIPYNAVLVYSDACFANGTQLGDTLAAYVAQGGGVVLAGHSFAAATASGNSTGNGTVPAGIPACQTVGGQLRGAASATCAAGDTACQLYPSSWIPVVGGDINTAPAGTTIAFTRDRLWLQNNVSAPLSIAGARLSVPRQGCDISNATATTCAHCAGDNQTLALWSDGTPLVVEWNAARSGYNTALLGRLVVLNIDPVSADARNGSWSAAANPAVPHLLANTLVYAAAGPGYRCPATVTVPPANITANATASTRASRNALLLLPGSSVYEEDVRLNLLDDFDCVDLVSATASGTLTVTLLQRYQAVLVSTAAVPRLLATSNVLNAYVSGGGGIVLAGLGTVSALTGVGVSDNWLPIAVTAGVPPTNGNTTLTLQPVDATSPIIANISTFTIPTTALANFTAVPVAGATVVAQFSNAQPLVVQRTVGTGRVVSLSYRPTSSEAALNYAQASLCTDERALFWDGKTDGGALIANALRFVQHEFPAPLEQSGAFITLETSTADEQNGVFLPFVPDF